MVRIFLTHYYVFMHNKLDYNLGFTKHDNIILSIVHWLFSMNGFISCFFKINDKEAVNNVHLYNFIYSLFIHLFQYTYSNIIKSVFWVKLHLLEKCHLLVQILHQ